MGKIVDLAEFKRRRLKSHKEVLEILRKTRDDLGDLAKEMLELVPLLQAMAEAPKAR